MLKITIGLFLALAIGAACRYFDVPVPAPPKLLGAMLVVALTVGYVGTDRIMSRDHSAGAASAGISGGPTGETVRSDPIR